MSNNWQEKSDINKQWGKTNNKERTIEIERESGKVKTRSSCSMTNEFILSMSTAFIFTFLSEHTVPIRLYCKWPLIRAMYGDYFEGNKIDIVDIAAITTLNNNWTHLVRSPGDAVNFNYVHS